MSKVIHFPTEEQAHDGRVTQQESYIIPFVLRLPAQGYLGKSRAPGHRVRVWDRYHSAVSGGVVVYCCCKKCFLYGRAPQKQKVGIHAWELGSFS